MLTSSALGALAIAFVSGTVAHASASDKFTAPQNGAIQQVVAEADIMSTLPELNEGAEISTPKSYFGLVVTALAGIIGGLFGIFGANRIFKVFCNVGSWLGGGAKKAADATLNRAKTAAGAAVKAGSHVFRTPGRWLLVTLGLAFFVITGIAVLDIDWLAGVLTGVGITGIAAYGVQKARNIVKNVMKKSPMVRGKNDTVKV